MRVLVTGSSGFVGGWMGRQLRAAGDELIDWPDEIDLRDPAAVEREVRSAAPDAVCHLAARASVAASWGDPGGTFAVNVVGTVHLLDSLSRCRPVPRVLLISSAEVYGAVRPGELPLTEEQPFAPVSPYAASKAAAEMAGIQAWLGRGVEVVRARPFSHIGAGQRPDFVVPSMARQLVEASRTGSRTLMVGNLGARRDFTDVRDVVRAYRLLLEHGEAGAVYNVCSGVSRPISEIVDRLLALSGLDVEVRVDPARFRPSDLPDLRGDPSRLTARTGWLPEVDLDRTLADVLADCTAGDAVSD